MNARDFLLDLLVPAFCVGCDRRLARGPAGLLLCARCRGRLAPLPRDSLCTSCARPLPPGSQRQTRCIACHSHPPPYDRLIAVWSYGPPLDRVIRALKFRRLDFLIERLADEALRHQPFAADGPFDSVVPVPLSTVSRLQRGFDQAERLAERLALRLNVSLARPLRRRARWTRPQSRLGREDRRSNLRDAFVARSPFGLGGQRLLLVDDVFTTGATLGAAARTLRSAGCGPITAFALAATPLETDWRSGGVPPGPHAANPKRGEDRAETGAAPPRLDSSCQPP